MCLATMAYIYVACAVFLVFWPVSNFTELHALTLVACSYVLLYEAKESSYWGTKPRVMAAQAKSPVCLTLSEVVAQGVELIELSFLILQDLNRLGRDLRKVVIIDNSPQSYIFHPDNAVSGVTHTSTTHFT